MSDPTMMDLARRLAPHMHALIMPRFYVSASYTPTYVGGTTAGTTTYNANGQVGYYVRVAELCYFTAWVDWSAATGTGEARVSVPFTAKNVTNLFQGVSVFPNGVTYSQDFVTALITPNTSYIVFRSPLSNAGGTNVNVEAAGLLVVSGVYIIQ